MSDLDDIDALINDIDAVFVDDSPVKAAPKPAPKKSSSSSSSFSSRNGRSSSSSSSITSSRSRTSSSRSDSKLGKFSTRDPSSSSSSSAIGGNTNNKKPFDLVSDATVDLSHLQAAPTVKCRPIVLGNAKSFKTCAALACTSCDHKILQIKDHVWKSTAAYMHFRNYHPNLSKLKSELTRKPGSCAYCCQCNWRSVDNDTTPNQYTDPKLRWHCTGC